MKKLPTDEEVQDAMDAIAGTGPVPLAQFIDRNLGLTAMIANFSAAILSDPLSLKMILKAVFVLGLHLGITIGERYGRSNSEGPGPTTM